MEKQLIEVTKSDRDNAMMHLRLGFLALRIAELGSRSRYEDAGSEFEWAAELKPEWPYPWLGLGKTEAGTADTTYGLKARFHAMFGSDPMTLAAEALRKSTRIDSAFVPGLTALVSVVARQRLNADPEEALAIVRRAARTEAGQVLNSFWPGPIWSATWATPTRPPCSTAGIWKRAGTRRSVASS